MNSINRKRLIIGIVAAVIIIIIAVLVVRSGSSTQDNPLGVTNTSEDTGTTAVATGSTLYTDPGQKFTFAYPKDLTVVGPDNKKTTEWRENATTSGFLLATITVPKSYMPGTNFSDAKFTVGSSNSAAELSGSGCPSGVSFSEAPGSAVAVPINGQTYTKITTSDAGAGNFYETTSYFTVRNGNCYDIEYTIHSTNIANYPASAGIKQFDKDQVTSMLDAIVRSFAFTGTSQ